MTPSFQQKFKEEAQEIFQALEGDLLTLETNPTDRELIDKIFRGLHTLKGSGAMFGFDRLAHFAHEVETLFDLVRTDKLSISAPIISLSLEACDHLKFVLDGPPMTTADEEREQGLVSAIQAYLPPADTPEAASPPVAQAARSGSSQKIIRIYFKPDRELFIKGINPVVLFNNLNALGRCFVFAHEEAVPPLGQINPESCYLFWTCLLISDASMDAIRDVFIFTEGSCELSIEEIAGSPVELEERAIPLIGEILFNKGDISQNDIETVLSGQRRFGESIVALGATTPEKVASALFEQSALKTIKTEFQTQTAASSIRVHNEKLDILTNAVSELVTLQARLTQYAEAKRQSELTAIAEYLEKLTSSLRDTVMMIRMVPVEEGFTAMHRLVRDLAKNLEKEVSLVIIGGDTELDKAVIDNLKDPMMHLVRNCIDHGLESPAERVGAGKSPSGTVTIKAEHVGSHVTISVSDDGKGLNAKKIMAKAVEKGLVSASETLSERQIYELIFVPGFSTAEKTTNVSGRGVGMDVVKRTIESIRGEVLIDSQPGQGTTITMKLPLTLAIIDGLLFSVENELFVVNISAVSECLELTPEIRKAAAGRNILKLRDMVVPFVHLRSILNISGQPPEHEQIIIIHTHEQTLGLVVDAVAGKHQTVVKMTGRLFANVKEVTGATILGDGRIALILDVNCIANKANRQSQPQLESKFV